MNTSGTSEVLAGGAITDFLAVEILRVSDAACVFWHDRLPALANRVRRELLASPESDRLLGTADASELPRLIEHHGRLLHAALSTRSVSSLAAGLRWIYRSQLQRGFDYDFLPAEFVAWQKALTAEDIRDSMGLLSFFDGLHEIHPRLVEWSMIEDVEPATHLGVEAHRLLDALLEGDERWARRICANAEPVKLWSELVGPAMRHIGELWASGTIEVVDEHRATAMLTRIIDSMENEARAERPTRPRRSRRRVVLALPSGEVHDLPARMLRSGLEEAGHDVVFMGADVPAHTLGLWLRRHPADLLVVPTVMMARLIDVREMVRHARTASPAMPIVVGGQAYESDSELWRTTGADSCMQTMPELLDYVKQVQATTRT